MEKETKYKENNMLKTPLSPDGLRGIHSILIDGVVDFIENDIPHVLFAMLRHYIDDPKVESKDKWFAFQDVENIIALHTELRIVDKSENFRLWEELPNGEFKAPIYE
ncbi:hypothetical protein [Parabacteroides pacaensis]|uniref:hypothetical protein n=1 Tax=Parabacteroides pacaensis TaxID=2086575 RepID=UPI000D0F3DB0|nr:hypothetical protein [Parabacteroides pacaensis]